MYKAQTALTFACLVAFPFLLAGCTNTPVALDSEGHHALLKQDQLVDTETKTLKLTLDEALDIAVAANLDARIAEMEYLVQQKNVTLKELEALPSISHTRSVRQRSNDGASSSRSVLSGLESLEPSQSTDKRRITSELAANWDMVNAAVTLAEAERMNEEAKIVGERYNKVIQNIERDVHAAYWRAWAHQQTKSQTRAILGDSQRLLANFETAIDGNLLSTDDGGDRITDITGRMRTLLDMDKDIGMAQTELKTLLSLPQSINLELAKPPRRESEIKTLLRTATVDQEWEALKNRPEMREEILQKNVAIKNIHHEIIRTFPGGELAFSFNNDTNSFLQSGDWTTFSMSVVQNVLNVFTLPARFHAAKQKEKLSDARRQALNAAIVTQVHLGKMRLDKAGKSWATASRASNAAYKKSLAKRMKSKSGLASGNDVVLASLDSQIESMRRYVAEAEYQDSYAAMVNSLGKNLRSSPPTVNKGEKP